MRSVLLALCLAATAQAYRVIININSFPSSMMTSNWDAWAPARDLADGVMAIGAPNREEGETPMTSGDARRVIGLFQDGFRIANTPWHQFLKYDSHEPGNASFYFNQRYSGQPDLNLDDSARRQPNVFIWKVPGPGQAGEIERMLTPTELDVIRASGLPPVYILASSTSTASFEHPWCKGAYVEGAPAAWSQKWASGRWRFEVATAILAAGKELVVLSNAIMPGGDVTRHIESVGKMLDTFFERFGSEVMCSSRVTFAMSDYTSKLPYLPMHIPGTLSPENSFAGGLLLMGQQKTLRCP